MTRGLTTPRTQRDPPTRDSTRIIRGTAAYTAGGVLQRAVLFLLLPFFTRVLSPSEFGQIGVLTTIASGLTVVVGFGLETAVFRGYLRADTQTDSGRVFTNTVVSFGLVAPLSLAGAFAAFGAEAIAPIFDVPVDALRLACAGAGATAATLVPLALLRSQERLRDYLQLTALQVVVTPVLAILFVAVLGWSVTGWMLSYALGGGVLLVRGLAILGHRWSFDFNVQQLRNALEFGLPLVPHAMSHWGLSVSDRAILGAFVSAPQVGAYYLAYLFCLPISLVAIALSQATQPLYAVVPVPDAQIGRVITIQTVLIVLVAIAVAVLGPAVSLTLLPGDYAATASLIPWLAAGSALFGLYLMPMAAVALVAGRTQRVWIITLLAALANIGLNLIFVPRFGTAAAAVNTTIGYGLLLVGVFLYMRRVCDPPIPYEWKRIAMGTLVIGLPSIIAAAVIPPDSVLGLAARTAVIVAVSILLLIGPFKREAAAVWRAIIPGKAGGRA